MEQFRVEFYEDITETVLETVESSFKFNSDVVKSHDVDSSSPVISQEGECDDRIVSDFWVSWWEAKFWSYSTGKKEGLICASC